MALTSTDVNNQSFTIERKGYNVTQVDDFLEVIANELDALNAENEDLRAKLRSKPEQAPVSEPSSFGVSRFELDQRDARIRELEAALTERRADDSAIAQALIIAQRSADEVLANANTNAEITRRDAEDEAQRILDKAQIEKQRVLDEIKKLEDDREDARTRYVDLLSDFISSSQDILVELEGKRLIGAKRAYNPALQVSAAGYTVPTANAAVAAVAPSVPRPAQVEKDFSGFGDTEDAFDVNDLD